MSELLPELARVLALWGLACTAPALELVPDLRWPGAYLHDPARGHIIQLRPAPDLRRALLHEMAHCALYERRERLGQPHPRPLDLREELAVHHLEQLGLAWLEGNDPPAEQAAGYGPR